jgi:glutamine synthetase
LLHAGLEGIEKGYKLPSEMTTNLYRLSDEERVEQGIEALPGSLGEAIDAFAASDLLERAFGEHIFPRYAQLKRAEWDEYRMQVTQWELDRYLKAL